MADRAKATLGWLEASRKYIAFRGRRGLLSYIVALMVAECGVLMLFPISAQRATDLAVRLLIVTVLLAAGCSDDPTGTGLGVEAFTEGLTFQLVVNGSWSSDPADPQGRTQGLVRVTVANKSQVWLGSDTMSPVGDTAAEKRYQATVRFRDLDPGVVVVRIVFQHYDGETDQQVVTTLREISTVGGDPIEIEAGKVTDIGTVEVTIPIG